MRWMCQGNLQAVHNRGVSVSTYAAGDDAVIVEGVLTDNRIVDTNALLIAMASAVLQGFWNARPTRRLDARRAPEGTAPEYLIDICWVLRSEGPPEQELRAAVRGQDREGGGLNEG